MGLLLLPLLIEICFGFGILIDFDELWAGFIVVGCDDVFGREADWNGAFNFSSNLGFLANCIRKTKGMDYFFSWGDVWLLVGRMWLLVALNWLLCACVCAEARNPWSINHIIAWWGDVWLQKSRNLSYHIAWHINVFGLWLCFPFFPFNDHGRMNPFRRFLAQIVGFSPWIDCGYFLLKRFQFHTE